MEKLSLEKLVVNVMNNVIFSVFVVVAFWGFNDFSKQKYLDYIFNAEKYLYEQENYHVALEYYMKALEDYKDLYAEDAMNALQCIVIINSDKDLTKKIVSILFAKGLTLKNFNPKIKKYLGDHQLIDFCNELDEHFLLDRTNQEALALEMRKIVLFDSLSNSNFHKCKFSDEDLTHWINERHKLFKTFILNYGFPSERIIGVNFDNKLKVTSYPMYNALLAHCYMHGDFIVDDQIKMLEEQFALHPRVMSVLDQARSLKKIDEMVYILNRRKCPQNYER